MVNKNFITVVMLLAMSAQVFAKSKSACQKEKSKVSGRFKKSGKSFQQAKQSYYNCLKKTDKIKNFEDSAENLSRKDKELLNRLARQKIRTPKDVTKETIGLVNQLSPEASKLIMDWEKMDPTERDTYNDLVNGGVVYNWVAAAVVAIYVAEKLFESASRASDVSMPADFHKRTMLLDY
jgi:hypothetical protein